MTNQGPYVQPDLRSLLDSERDVTLANINKVLVGTVQSYNAATQSALIQPVIQRAVFNTAMTTSAVPPDPTIYNFPLLVDVPVFVFSGGGAYFSMPISKGDFAVVLFSDVDLDPWWSNGTLNAVPNSARRHSLADGLAIVGLRPKGQPINAGNWPTDGQHMAIGNASGTLRQALDAMMNQIASLMTNIDGLMINLQNWVNTDSTTPDSSTVTNLNGNQVSFSDNKTAFAAAKAQYDALFQ